MADMFLEWWVHRRSLFWMWPTDIDLLSGFYLYDQHDGCNILYVLGFPCTTRGIWDHSKCFALLDRSFSMLRLLYNMYNCLHGSLFLAIALLVYYRLMSSNVMLVYFAPPVSCNLNIQIRMLSLVCLKLIHSLKFL